MSDLGEMLDSLSGGGGQLAPCDESERAQLFADLRQRVLSTPVPFDISQRPVFERGDAVRFREGFANKKNPRAGAAVVVQQLDEPVINDKNPGSPYFREPLDLIIGEIDADGDYLEFYVDSRRMEHTDPPA